MIIVVSNNNNLVKLLINVKNQVSLLETLLNPEPFAFYYNKAQCSLPKYIHG
jgi:hypothetical protein